MKAFIILVLLAFSSISIFAINCHVVSNQKLSSGKTQNTMNVWSCLLKDQHNQVQDYAYTKYGLLFNASHFNESLNVLNKVPVFDPASYLSFYINSHVNYKYVNQRIMAIRLFLNSKVAQHFKVSKYKASAVFYINGKPSQPMPLYYESNNSQISAGQNEISNVLLVNAYPTNILALNLESKITSLSIVINVQKIYSKNETMTIHLNNDQISVINKYLTQTKNDRFSVLYRKYHD